MAITVAAVATETSIPGAATLTAEAAVSSVAAIITKAVATSVATLAAETSITRVAALIAEALTAGVAALTTKATVIATLAAEAPVTSIAAETSVITIAAITTVTTVGMAASIARATTIHEACWFRARWPASRTIGFTCALGWCAGVATPVLAISLGRRRAGEGSFTHAFPVEVGDAYRPCRTGRGRWAGCGIAGGALDAKSTAWPRRIIHGGLR